MAEKINLQWERAQILGKRKYALKIGVLYWGGSMTLFFTFVNPLLNSLITQNHNFSYSQYLFSSQFFIIFTVSFLLFSIVGYFYGLNMWKKLEKRNIK